MSSIGSTGILLKKIDNFGLKKQEKGRKKKLEKEREREETINQYYTHIFPIYRVFAEKGWKKKKKKRRSSKNGANFHFFFTYEFIDKIVEQEHENLLSKKKKESMNK